jgi:AP-1-like factor
MDYNSNYFTASTQQYGFPVHQLPTPGPGSLSIGSDDYSTNSPPVRGSSYTSPSPPHSFLTRAQEANFHDFQTFDPYTQQQFPITKPLTPPIQQLPKHTPQINNNPGLGGYDIGNFQDQEQERRDSPSDDEEKTPAQTRRKAQNRAA